MSELTALVREIWLHSATTALKCAKEPTAPLSFSALQLTSGPLRTADVLRTEVDGLRSRLRIFPEGSLALL